MAGVQKDEYPNGECFIIMPITDPPEYKPGHFRKVYEDIFIIACKNAGYKAVRADDVKETNMIQLDVLDKLLNSPMAICDLSSRNPNVMFELGFRQAFDKPTVLVQEMGTSRVFDISPIRAEEYSGNLEYRSVNEDQIKIQRVLEETKRATDNDKGVNSLVRLLSLSSPAALKQIKEDPTAEMVQLILSEMRELKTILRKSSDSMKTATDEEFRTGVEKIYQSMEKAINENATAEALHRLIYELKNLVLSRQINELLGNTHYKLEFDPIFKNIAGLAENQKKTKRRFISGKFDEDIS